MAEWDGEEEEDGEEDDHQEHSKDQEHPPPAWETKIPRLNQDDMAIYLFIYSLFYF